MMYNLKISYWRIYWLIKAGVITRSMYASAALMGGVVGLAIALV